jgi:hypothetical protein
MPPIENFNTRGPTHLHNQPYPGGTIIDADHLFGPLQATSAAFGPLLLGKFFGFPQPGPIAMTAQLNRWLTACLIRLTLNHRYRHRFDFFPALIPDVNHRPIHREGHHLSIRLRHLPHRHHFFRSRCFDHCDRLCRLLCHDLAAILGH